MESGNGGASSKGYLVPVPESSDVFQNSILAPLKNAYLYEESKQSFRYKSALLINNPALEEKYNAFRAKRREAGYSEEDLKESYGFLLFDNVDKAYALGETGVLTGNSTCTTLGDPSNGVYISMYSDCLDSNRWYHGKSGYIAIIRLTKGRVKEVSENYTETLTAPTAGFDSHVSENLSSVSSNTSFFLAFERTQYYMYELLDDGSNDTAKAPSAACPFAIVKFSYTDTKATFIAPQEKSEEKKTVNPYFPWRGQLQMGTQPYKVGLRSASGALIPIELPPVVKVDQAISMLNLRQLLPRAVFETFFSGEVFLDGLYCSLFEFVACEEEDTNSFYQLLCEVKEKDVALVTPLSDGGFLFLVHSQNFLTYDETGSSASEVFQGVFVFPGSRVIQRDTKLVHRKATTSAEILRVLPVLSYAESEAEKASVDPSEELCEVLAQYMQSYAALINPGLDLSPSREVSIFADQYDVPDAHTHLYASPEWTNRAWQSLKSYLSKPVSFQLPVAKASEILVAGPENRIEDLDDDVYICLSSPEAAPASPACTPTDQLAGQKSSVNVQTFVDSCTSLAYAQDDLSDGPQNIVQKHLQTGGFQKETETPELSVLIKTDDMRTNNLSIPSTSDESPTELIVSITSEERTDKSVISPEAANKLSDFQILDLSTDKTQIKLLNDETTRTKKLLESPEVNNIKKTKRRKVRRSHFKRHKKVSNCVETSGLPTVLTPVEYNHSETLTDLAKEAVSLPGVSKRSIADWRSARRRKVVFGKLSSRHKKVRSCTVGPVLAKEEKTDSKQERLESTILKELEACPMRKKMERWDLKPVLSECGRILVPHGSKDIADKIKSLTEKLQSTKSEQCLGNMLGVTSEESNGPAKVEEKSSIAPVTEVDTIETTTLKDGEIYLKNNTVSDSNLEHSIFRPQDAGDDSSNVTVERTDHFSKNDCPVTSSSDFAQEKQSDTPASAKCTSKSEFLLSRLKSVLLKGKRKMDLLGSGEMTAGKTHDAEPCLKMNKVDTDTHTVKSNDAITSVPDTSLGLKEVSRMLSVDPLFAYALGLTPKKIPKMVQKNDIMDSQQRINSSQTQEQTQPEIVLRPTSIFPRRGRIKTLKKHQDVSTENVKKKWWLHFQTPACFASENLKNKECTSDNSVRKSVKEKMNSDCSSADALNLLADLALSASHDQVPPQPDQALERKPETSLKKHDLAKDVTSVDQESVLHALLRQPTSRSIQALESPSPSHLVGGSELGGLVSREHAYSLPPLSSLPLGLPVTPLQVSPLSGSTGPLPHQMMMHDDGNSTLQPSVAKEGRSEQDCRTPDLKKHMMRRRKFRHSRTFIDKGGLVQVTKDWKGNYDFSLDSKFTSDSKDRAIIRALHGPWDDSVQDTSEEVRLIVHMWIGLFYSRSTARFFHIDPNLPYLCSEESDVLGMPSGITSGSDKSEVKASSGASFLSVPEPSDSSSSKELDLSKKGDPSLDQGFVVLDLSLKNSTPKVVPSDPQVSRKDTSGDRKTARKTIKTKSSEGIHKASPSQCHKGIESCTREVPEVNNGRSLFQEQRTFTLLHKPLEVEHTTESSLKGGTFILLQKVTESVSVLPENNQSSATNAVVFTGCKNEKTDDTETIEMKLVHQYKRDSSQSMTDDKVDFNKAKQAGEVATERQQDEIGSKNGETLKVKEKPHVDSIAQRMMQTADNQTNEKSEIMCNGNLSENEKQFSTEEPKAISQGTAENVNEDVDCCTVSQSEALKEDDAVNEKQPDDKDTCCSSLEPDRGVGSQTSSAMCDGSNSVKNCIIKNNCHAKLSEPPFQANKEGDLHDSQSRELGANDKVWECGNTITKEAACMLSKLTDDVDGPVIEKKSENDIYIKNEANESDRDCSIPGSNTSTSIPKTNESIETTIQNKEMASINHGTVQEDIDATSVKGSQKHDEQIPNEVPTHQSHGLQCEPMNSGSEEAPITETDFGRGKTSGELEKIDGRVVIPFIGIDISQDDAELLHDSQEKAKETVRGQKDIPSIRETTCSEPVQHTESTCTSQMYKKKAEQSPGNVSLLDIPKTNQLEVSGSESDDRCPTPTMDEKPYGSLPSSGPGGSTSELSRRETCRITNNVALKRSSNSRQEKMHTEQTSTAIDNHDSHHGLHPDLEQRTLRVLQSINKFFYESSQSNKSSEIEVANIKRLDKAPHPCSNYTISDLKEHEILNKMSASNFQDGEPSGDFAMSTFESNIEKALGYGLQLKKTESSVNQQCFERNDKLQETSFRQDYCHLNRSPPPTECFSAIKPIDHDRYTSSSKANLNHEARSHSQRPVMAVKPSKNDETHAEIKNSSFPNNSKISMATSATPSSSLLKEKSNHRMASSGRLHDDSQKASRLSDKRSWLSYARDRKSDKAKFAYQDPKCEGSNVYSSIPEQSPGSTKSSSHLVDGKPGFSTNHVAERVGQTAKESLEIDQMGSSHASSSRRDHKDDGVVDDSLYLGPESSLTCTVYNTNRKRSYSLLEQLSQRCLQDDPTDASMEKECLIFSEKMKQLLKKSNRGAMHQQGQRDKLKSSCPSPVTVHFSGLEEQEDSLDFSVDPQSILGQKIKVDMSDRDREELVKKEKSSHSSQGTSVEHAGVSSVTAECAELYDEMMNDICAVRKVPSNSKHLRMDRGETESNNYFDFCDQMKKEMDESFRSNLNSIVKKSCKTKYRFYLLVTSDDEFFEETKALLEAEGHTSVEPSEFLLGGNSLSPLLIILRNEDIAEHICEVPHLLKLKKSPEVQFAGVDEPDDVVNLTHQELFRRGGFMMFDRAALEPLSLCNMKKMSEVLQELGKSGKWKWMLHYRDSRWFKENARLNTEAKEKKQFLNWCQEEGILEVLPYHECDLVSRDQPDYLACLVRLQVQNISARHTVFITDTDRADGAFASNGILTMTFNTFMTCSMSSEFSL